MVSVISTLKFNTRGIRYSHWMMKMPVNLKSD